MPNTWHATRMHTPCSVTAFFEGLRHDLSLELFLEVHLLWAPVLFFELFHAGYRRHIHAAIFGSPLAEGSRTNAQLCANVRHRKTSFAPFDRIHDLAVGEF